MFHKKIEYRRNMSHINKKIYYNYEHINDQTFFLFSFYKAFIKQIISKFLCNDIVNIIIDFIEPKKEEGDSYYYTIINLKLN